MEYVWNVHVILYIYNRVLMGVLAHLRVDLLGSWGVLGIHVWGLTHILV